ncbi:Phosphatidylglycerophosphatase and protein-tyrosine phosphatase 1 [Halotydeus destructor]|nr:Phosphatidylglycerophosphatase and protein-tyrosine phosphatase 1 [Halotydeus destructor]
MFGRVTFYPTLVYNVVLEKLHYRQWYSRIDETIVLGALPWRTLAPQLIKDEKVRAVVSMNEDFELQHWVPSREEWKSQGVDFLQLNTPDIFHAPTQAKIREGVSFIRKFEGSGNSVYVHCKAGRTRSATLVGCYLIEKHRWTPNEAVDFMKSKRHHILLHTKQWDALKEYYDKNIGKDPQSLKN